MTEKRRKEACLRLRALLDAGKPRKLALLKLTTELRKAGLPSSQPSIYAWCKQFGISTR